MGAVASAMARQGYKITGSDAKVYPPMSTFLEGEGIKITEGYAAENLPTEANFVVVGNAISRGNEELEAVLERRLTYKSLPECMKDTFLRGKRNYVVSGTHGKTTTTSMLAWLMESCALNPSFMIGGIAANLGRGGRFSDSDFCVLEGDEYDTAFFDKRSKFLHYLPELVIINNIEMDHADIYNNVDEIKLSFERLLRIVPRNGRVLINADCPHSCDVARLAPKPVSIISLGFSPEANMPITEISYNPEGSHFTLEGHRYFVPMVGDFNIRNAAMATAAALFAGLSPEPIASALASFKGIARRQELRGEVAGVRVIDDFAHHPTAIELAIQALRQRYVGARLWAIFDPRSNTSGSNLFQKEIASALAQADIAVVAPVERAEKHSSETILKLDLLKQDIEKSGKSCYLGQDVDDIVAHISAQSQAGDVLLVMSNGGFGNIHNKLLDALKA